MTLYDIRLKINFTFVEHAHLAIMASTSFNKFSSDSNLKPVMTEVNGYVLEVSDVQVAKSGNRYFDFKRLNRNLRE